MYAPIFWLQECDGLGSAGLVITKIFWEKLVAVKWSLAGSMYMTANTEKKKRLTAQNALISHGGSTIRQNVCTHFLVAKV